MPPSSYTIVANSTFLDAYGALAVGPGDPTGALRTLNNNTANDIQTAANVLAPLLANPGQAAGVTLYADQGNTAIINVGIMLERAAPQATVDTLLGSDWADRQTTITTQGNAIWSTYGADQTTYTATQQAILAALDIPLDRASNPFTLAAAQGYGASVDNRTIWMSLSADQFNTLFNSVLLTGNNGPAWTGPLSLPSTIDASAIDGLWVDLDVGFNNPVLPPNVGPSYPAPGSVSLGNAAGSQTVPAALPSDTEPGAG